MDSACAGIAFSRFLLREECSLCIVAHRVQKCARIAADFFGLRSFEVLGFGRATRLVSAMPVLILRFGRRMCGSATKERFLGLVQPFGVAQFCPRGRKWSFGGNEKGYQHLTCKDDTRSTNDRTPTSARRTSPNRKVQPHNFSLQQDTKGGAVLCTCCVSLFTVSLQTHLSQQTLVGSLKTSQHVCAPLWDSV